MVPVPELKGNFFESNRKSIKEKNISVFDKGSNLTRKTTQSLLTFSNQVQVKKKVSYIERVQMYKAQIDSLQAERL